MNHTSKPSLDSLLVERPTKMSLIEEGNNFVARLEAGDLLANFYNYASTIGAGNNAVGNPEWILAFGDDQIPVVEGHALDCIVISS